MTALLYKAVNDCKAEWHKARHSSIHLIEQIYHRLYSGPAVKHSISSDAVDYQTNRHADTDTPKISRIRWSVIDHICLEHSSQIQ